jgi:hypothetical protein
MGVQQLEEACDAVRVYGTSSTADVNLSTGRS